MYIFLITICKFHLKFCQFLPDLDEAEVQFAAKVVGEPPVVVVDPQVRRAHLTHPQLLLLVAAGRHRVAVNVFRLSLLLTQLFNLNYNTHSIKAHICMWARSLPK
jgi:hypothetical protein